MAESNVFSLRLDCMKNLKGFVCSVKADYKLGGAVSSIYHQRILKCRELIFSNPQVLSGLDPKNKENIFVVFVDNQEEQSKIKEEINNLDLKLCGVQGRATPKMLVTALEYTITTRLSPLWNIVGSFCVYGEDFLYNKLPLDAIKLKLSPYRNKVDFNLSCYKLTLLKIDEEHLDDVNNKDAYVLPKMSECEILSGSRVMPTIRFRNYAKLVEHWKKLYGYVLPSTQENMVFYDVCFPYMKYSNILTYPGLCLNSGIEQNEPSSTEKENIVKKFINDFTERFPTIFGRPFDFGTKEMI